VVKAWRRLGSPLHGEWVLDRDSLFGAVRDAVAVHDETMLGRVREEDFGIMLG